MPAAIPTRAGAPIVGHVLWAGGTRRRGRPSLSQRAWSLEFIPPLVRNERRDPRHLTLPQQKQTHRKSLPRGGP